MANRKTRAWIKAAISLSLCSYRARGFFIRHGALRVWHLRFPNGVHYRSRDIYVPPDWIADDNGVTVRLIKYPKTLFEKIPQGLISLTPAGETLQRMGSRMINGGR